MGGWFVWDGLFLLQVVGFLGMTISYCLVVVSRKDRNDNIRKRRQCCRCHHGHLSHAATSDAAAVADVETANTAADDNEKEEKQELLMNTSSDTCCCCCCSGGGDSTTAGGQSNCKLSGDGADQDPRIKSITKRFRMITGITLFVHLGIFMMYLLAVL